MLICIYLVGTWSVACPACPPVGSPLPCLSWLLLPIVQSGETVRRSSPISWTGHLVHLVHQGSTHAITQPHSTHGWGHGPAHAGTAPSPPLGAAGVALGCAGGPGAAVAGDCHLVGPQCGAQGGQSTGHTVARGRRGQWGCGVGHARPLAPAREGPSGPPPWPGSTPTLTWLLGISSNRLAELP